MDFQGNKMDVFKTLKPHDPGTKRYLRKYGDKLVAVRYRKGTNPDQIYTTVEVIVDARPYTPGITHTPARSQLKTQPVALRVGLEEIDIQQKIRNAGGKWNRQQQAWILEYGKVCELKLKGRIIKKQVV